MANISNAMMADLLDLKPSGIIRLEDKVMGGGVISPQERDARRMQGLANQLGQQGLSGLGGVSGISMEEYYQQQRPPQQPMSADEARIREEHRRMEEMRRMFPSVRDLRPIVDDMKRDIDKVDIRTYLQAKTDDWLRGVEL